LKILKNIFTDLEAYEVMRTSSIELYLVSRGDHRRIKKEFFDHLNKALKHKSEKFVHLHILSPDQKEQIPPQSSKIRL